MPSNATGSGTTTSPITVGTAQGVGPVTVLDGLVCHRRHGPRAGLLLPPSGSRAPAAWPGLEYTNIRSVVYSL